MSEYNDLAFFIICQKMGAGLFYLGLVPACGLVREPSKILQLPHLENSLPIFVQIFGSDQQIMAEAARIIEDLGFEGIDINAGCPSPKITKLNSGAALMEDLSQAEKVVKAVRSAVKISVTIKMRLGSKEDSFLKMGKIAEESGLDGVILHPRTTQQGFSGKADWKKIAQLKAQLKIPVLASGDVRDAASFLQLRKETNCDGVLIGRAALGNPWIFHQCQQALEGKEALLPSLEERKEVILAYLHTLFKFYSQREAEHLAKKQLLHFLRGLPKASSFRRELMSKSAYDLELFIEDCFEKIEVINEEDR